MAPNEITAELSQQASLIY